MIERVQHLVLGLGQLFEFAMKEQADLIQQAFFGMDRTNDRAAAQDMQRAVPASAMIVLGQFTVSNNRKVGDERLGLRRLHQCRQTGSLWIDDYAVDQSFAQHLERARSIRNARDLYILGLEILHRAFATVFLWLNYEHALELTRYVVA